MVNIHIDECEKFKKDKDKYNLSRSNIVKNTRKGY